MNASDQSSDIKAIHENFVVFENFNEKKFFLLSNFTIMGFGMLSKYDPSL